MTDIDIQRVGLYGAIAGAGYVGFKLFTHENNKHPATNNTLPDNIRVSVDGTFFDVDTGKEVQHNPDGSWQYKDFVAEKTIFEDLTFKDNLKTNQITVSFAIQNPVDNTTIKIPPKSYNIPTTEAGFLNVFESLKNALVGQTDIIRALVYGRVWYSYLADNYYPQVSSIMKKSGSQVTKDWAEGAPDANGNPTGLRLIDHRLKELAGQLVKLDEITNGIVNETISILNSVGFQDIDFRYEASEHEGDLLRNLAYTINEGDIMGNLNYTNKDWKIFQSQQVEQIWKAEFGPNASLAGVDRSYNELVKLRNDWGIFNSSDPRYNTVFRKAVFLAQTHNPSIYSTCSNCKEEHKSNFSDDEIGWREYLKIRAPNFAFHSSAFISGGLNNSLKKEHINRKHLEDVGRAFEQITVINYFLGNKIRPFLRYCVGADAVNGLARGGFFHYSIEEPYALQAQRVIDKHLYTGFLFNVHKLPFLCNGSSPY